MTKYSFTETDALEAGFERVFHDRVVPILERYEATRQGFRKKALRGMGVSGVVGVGGIGGGIGYESTFGLFAGGAGALGAFGVKAYFEHQWKGGMGDEILPILCDFLGQMSYGHQNIRLDDFLRLGVIPSYDNSDLEDPVTGQHDGIDWALTEAHLKSRTRDSKGRNRTTTVFRGLLFRIGIQGPAPRIFFGRDRGGALNWLSETFSPSRSGLEKIEIPDPEFERVYETYTSDPAAAQAYIDHRLTAGLMEVARIEGGKSYLACAMEGDALYLALPRSGDFLGLGSLFRPLTTVENDLHKALSDLDLPSRVIDRLRGI